MVKRGASTGAILLLAALIPAAATAHGAVTMENDVCKMQIGRLFMHFTGYQPQNSRAEFCQDIPETGRAIIVLDMVDKQLRDTPISFAVVRTNGSGAMPDLAAIDRKDIIVKLDRRTYPNGSIKADMMFTEPGDYVGMVIADIGTPVMATFPFSVGQSSLWRSMMIFVGALVIVAGGVFAWVRKRTQHDRELSSKNEFGFTVR
jgi:hypothetical protein